jgi:hypothetical protein
MRRVGSVVAGKSPSLLPNFLLTTVRKARRGSIAFAA